MIRLSAFFTPLLGLVATLAAQETVTTETPTDAAPAAPAPDYIRYVETDSGASQLQTAVTRFQRGGQWVDLVSVVHLADADYYEGLDQRLGDYDYVLYEMVGGAFDPDKVEGAPVDAGPSEAGGIRQIQGMASSMLGLSFQLDSIDYERPHFVHADVDWELYQELMDAKNQSFSTMLTRAMSLSEQGKLPGVPTEESGLQAMMNTVLTAVTTGDSSGLKRVLAPMLGDAEAMIASIEGDDGTVLVTERNKVVMEKLKNVLAKGGASHAIFYGSGHMPDLEERLLDAGFQKTDTIWLDAWNIPAPGEEPEGEPAAPGENPLNSLLEALGENPELLDALGGQ